MKDQIIRYYKGLPGSGKSTLAKAWVNEDAINRVRVNKDDIRNLLHNGKYSKENEKQVLDTQDFIILDSLKRGKSVAFDNTHLVDKHLIRLNNLLKDNDLSNIKIEVVDLTSVEPEECIKRDLIRPNSVGQNVIWDMYWRFVAEVAKPPLLNNDLPYCIIVDVDGTLAEMHNRSPYDWSKVGDDKIRPHISELVDQYSMYDQEIIIFTGRDASCLEETKNWLHRHEVVYDYIYIRPEGDKRPDYIVKREMYERYIKNKYNVLLVVDDRPQVIREWRRLGLPVINANPCDKEF